MAVRGATASKYLRDLQNIENGSFPTKCILLGVNLALGLIAASAVIFQSCSPFGIGMVAQAGAGLPGMFCMLGACIGYLLVLGFSHGIKYIATTMSVFTIAFVFKEILRADRSTASETMTAAACTRTNRRAGRRTMSETLIYG